MSANPASQPASQSGPREGNRVALPRVVFGSSALGNLFEAPPDERKLDIVRAWLTQDASPIVIDSAGKYGAGLALESLGNCLRQLNVPPERVVIGNKLGWYRVPLTADEPQFEPGAWIDIDHDAEQRIGSKGILDCWRQGTELLGEPYGSAMASVHDPDEYLAGAKNDVDLSQRNDDLLAAYSALSELRANGQVKTIGVGSKDWRVAKQVADSVELDWVMLANCVTAHTHEPGVLDFIADLTSLGIAVINSGVFNAGFLVGGRYFDYRVATPDTDAGLFAWRDAFTALCERFSVRPAHACIQFGLSPPGVESVALNSTNPDRVRANVEMANKPVTNDLWSAAKEQGLISPDFPHLG